MEIAIVFAIFAAISLVIRFAADRYDRERIEKYVAERGGRVSKTRWTPFARGWVGEENSRFYLVDFTNKDGERFSKTCKTKMLGSVYWMDAGL